MAGPEEQDSKHKGRNCLLKRCGILFKVKRKHQVFCCAEHRAEHFWETHEVVLKTKLQALREKAGVKEWV